ncbi:MAG: murein hydrolase activator EnvC family protein [Alphaproteobacteria bacterium]
MISHASERAIKQEQLQTTKTRLSHKAAEKKRLQTRIEKIESELSDIKNQLRKTGRAMRQNEDKLRSTQERIDNLEARKKDLSENLQKERASIVKLILMLERIRKTPPEVMIARPNTPYHTAQSALLMKNIIPSVEHDAKHLKNKLEMLEQLSTDLTKERNHLEKETKSLKKNHAKLMSLVQDKEDLYAQIGQDIQAYQLSINSISLKARNLEELIAQIKIEEQKEIERQKQANIFRQKPRISKSFNGENGQANLPVSGIVRTTYQDKDEYGATSNGIIIEGRNAGLVIAPMGGKVQFVGSFKRFSNIVIIEHNEGYHSLIAGLGKISAVIGDIVKSGEPIGLLPDSTLIPRPKLYYELRKDGTPVNPSIKFSDLG